MTNFLSFGFYDEEEDKLMIFDKIKYVSQDFLEGYQTNREKMTKAKNKFETDLE